MGWTEIHNGEEDILNITHSGICRYSGKQAEVTAFFGSRLDCKTDLQKTYRFKGYRCSLQEKNAFQNLVCMDECPLIQKEHL